MKTSFVDIPIILGQCAKKPIFIELYEILRDAILDGRIKSGEALPSTRDLARKLGISRHTVLKSTNLLVTQGYLDSTKQKLLVFPQHDSALPSDEQDEFQMGNDADFSPATEPVSPEKVSNFAKKLIESNKALRFPELNFAPAPDDPTPLEQWQRLFLDKAKEEFDNVGVDPLGLECLRVAISKYLNRFRSLNCKSSNVVIFSGPTAALDFIGRLTLDSGDSILMENPGFKHARDVFLNFGAEIDTIDVDADGIAIEKLAHYSKQAKFLYVTPAHQNPTGATMSLDKRRELLAWSAETGTTIIEDGYDSEYWHRTSCSLPAIQGLDKNDSVIYVASFWRVLLPVTRISFAVFPDKWMNLVNKFKCMLERDVNILEQRVLTEFIEKGLYERALRKNQRVLSLRRQQLVIELMKNLGRRISLATQHSGTNLIVSFKTDASEEDIEHAALMANLPLVSTASYYVSNAMPKQYLLPFSNIRDEQLESIVSNFSNLVLQFKSSATQHVQPELQNVQPALLNFQLDSARSF